MGLLSFVGLFLAAYGPALALFFLVLAKNPQSVLLSLTSAFFWLISILLSSLVWFAWKSVYSTILVSVFFQELFRYLFYLLTLKAEKTLNDVSEKPDSVYNRPHRSFVVGFGFGLISALVMYVAELAETLGSAVIMCTSCPSLDIFFVAAIQTSIFTFSHIAWTMVFYDGLYKRQYWKPCLVILSHYGASFSTMLVPSSVSGGCYMSMAINFVQLCGMIVICQEKAVQKRKMFGFNANNSSNPTTTTSTASTFSFAPTQPTTQAPSTFNFGSSAPAFGANTGTGTSNTTNTTTTATSGFGGFNFGGNSNVNPATTSGTSTTAPAFGFSAPSTTTNTATGTTGLFGSNTGSTGFTGFGQSSTATTTATSGTTTGSTTGFGGGGGGGFSFGGAGTTVPSTPGPTGNSGINFGVTATPGPLTLTDLSTPKPTSTQPTLNLFGNKPSTTTATTTTTTASTATTTTATSGFGFGTGGFGGLGTNTTASTTATTTATTATVPSLFSNAGTTTSATTATTSSVPSLFAGSTGAVSGTTSSVPVLGMKPAVTTAPTGGSSLLGGSSSAATGTTATPTTTGINSGNASGGVGAGGPVVGGISTLKNKTMEEILNKWTSELDMYSKDFHRVAVQVSQWDEVLLRNGDQVNEKRLIFGSFLI
ncbi:anterior pharynx defective 1 [Nowakowskiella sp. JEL0407]|nr:anterior pharynx defective 1 [Nowakowskiella sp. JEL0407]